MEVFMALPDENIPFNYDTETRSYYDGAGPPPAAARKGPTDLPPSLWGKVFDFNIEDADSLRAVSKATKAGSDTFISVQKRKTVDFLNRAIEILKKKYPKEAAKIEKLVSSLTSLKPADLVKVKTNLKTIWNEFKNIIEDVFNPEALESLIKNPEDLPVFLNKLPDYVQFLKEYSDLLLDLIKPSEGKPEARIEVFKKALEFDQIGKASFLIYNARMDLDNLNFDVGPIAERLVKNGDLQNAFSLVFTFRNAGDRRPAREAARGLVNGLIAVGKMDEIKALLSIRVPELSFLDDNSFLSKEVNAYALLQMVRQHLLNDPKQAYELLQEFKGKAFFASSPNTSLIINEIITGFLNRNNVQEAIKIFDAMPSELQTSDVIQPIIQYCESHDQANIAQELRDRMNRT